jgi:selenocysteine lyase/cysteine desulfurase
MHAQPCPPTRPTPGLGALIVRNDALGALRRRYYGGGTVEVSLAEEPFHRLVPRHVLMLLAVQQDLQT